VARIVRLMFFPRVPHPRVLWSASEHATVLWRLCLRRHSRHGCAVVLLQAGVDITVISITPASCRDCSKLESDSFKALAPKSKQGFALCGQSQVNRINAWQGALHSALNNFPPSFPLSLARTLRGYSQFHRIDHRAHPAPVKRCRVKIVRWRSPCRIQAIRRPLWSIVHRADS
jgi:hypothetical protein